MSARVEAEQERQWTELSSESILDHIKKFYPFPEDPEERAETMKAFSFMVKGTRHQPAKEVDVCLPTHSYSFETTEMSCSMLFLLEQMPILTFCELWRVLLSLPEHPCCFLSESDLKFF